MIASLTTCDIENDYEVDYRDMQEPTRLAVALRSMRQTSSREKLARESRYGHRASDHSKTSIRNRGESRRSF